MVFYDPDKEGAQSKLFLYTLSTCVHCRAAKKLLAELGAAYDYVDVDTLPEDQMNEALEEMSQYNPAQSFPTILAGSRVIVGFHDEDIRKAAAKMKA
jgi:Glutaredoxin and related proteins